MIKLGLLLLACAQISALACAAGYLHCGTITINGYAGASTLTHYPLAVSGTFTGSAGAPDLRTTGNGGWVNNTIAQGALLDGIYVSGGTITGTVGQTCTLSSFNNSLASATATVTLTGTNTIATRTTFTSVTAPGSGGQLTPATSATLGSGTATCSGTATVLVHTTPTAIPADVIFTTDSSGTTPVAGFEWESYVASSGAAVFFVDTASLSGTSTKIYASIGKVSVTTWQGSVGGTWNSNFSAVYHQNGDNIDSTSNYNAIGGSRSVHFTTGVLANGMDGPNGGGGQQSAVSGTPTGFASGNTARSLEAWFTNGSSSDGTCRCIAGYGNSANGGSTNQTWTLYLQSNNSTMMVESDFNGGRGSCQPYGGGYFTTAPVNTGSTFHYAVAVLPASGAITNIALYVDNVSKALTYLNNGSTVINTQQADTAIGFINQTAANNPYTTGVVDEVRFMAAVPSTDWIAAVYANISSPATFFTFTGSGPGGNMPPAIF